MDIVTNYIALLLSDGHQPDTFRLIRLAGMVPASAILMIETPRCQPF